MAAQLKVQRWYAVYACRIGHVKRNLLLRNAGLGVTGSWERVDYALSWKPDEDVDEERAKKLEEPLKAAINYSGDFDCTDVTFVRLYKE